MQGGVGTKFMICITVEIPNIDVSLKEFNV